jgi:hypothetical protein
MKTKKIKIKKQENVIIGIYKITSPSNKVYIGKSTNIYKRWKGYNNLNENKKQFKIFNSLNKYGVTKHKFEIIEVCPPCKLDKREVYWKKNFIKEYGWDLALFCKIFDVGGGPLSEETRLKIGKALKGQKRPNLSKARKGIKLSKERCLALKVPKLNKRIKVIQLTLNNKRVKNWDSITIAETHFNNPKSDNIGACCRGKQKTAYGFKWKYSGIVK